MTRWTDETSYSRGQSAKTKEPRTWCLRLPWIILTVTRHIHYEPGQWFLCCRQLGIDMHELKAADIADAQREAINEAAARCKDYLNSLKGALKP